MRRSVLALGLLLSALASESLAAYPAPWPSRTGEGRLGRWEAYGARGLPHRDRTSPFTGGLGDDTTGALALPADADDLSSGTPDEDRPTAWWAYDATNDVLFVRTRVPSDPLDLGVAAGGILDPVGNDIGSGPWGPVSWVLTLDGDGDGLQDFAIVLDGASGGGARDLSSENLPAFPNPSGNPLHAGDDLVVYFGGSGQSIVPHDVVAGQVATAGDLVWHGEAATQAAAGDGAPPNGFAWDFGPTRCVLFAGDPDWGTDRVIDVQVPLAALRSAFTGGARLVEPRTPVQLGFSTTSDRTGPYETDVALPGSLLTSNAERFAFGDVIRPAAGRASAPVAGEMTLAPGPTCADPVAVSVDLLDAFEANPGNTPGSNAIGPVVDTVRLVRFDSFHDFDCDGEADDGGNWVPVSPGAGSAPNPDLAGTIGPDGVNDPATIFNDWGLRFDASILPDGCHLVRAVATDDDNGTTAAVRAAVVKGASGCAARRVATLGSFADASGTAPDDSFLSSDTAFFSGDGHAPAADAVLAFYDGAGNLAAAQSAVASLAGTLDLSRDLASDAAGTWTLVAYPSGFTPPATLTPSWDAASNPWLARHAYDVSTTDGDGDGLSDEDEAALGTNASAPDTDGDLLADREEVTPGADGFLTNPLDLDTDDDGLSDADELALDTDPTRADSDRDGVQDGTEAGRAAGIADPDAGGPLDGTGPGFVPDANPGSTTSPTDADTDDGGVADGVEDVNRNGAFEASEGDPNAGADDAPDGDADGVPDALEATLGTNPALADTDGDGLRDGEEPIPGADGHVTSPVDADSDDDALSDGEEVALTRTNPTLRDTDGDLLQDGQELGETLPLPDTGPGFVPDGDADATRTNPLDPDTDRGGAPDGLEDANLDGAVGPGERVPQLPQDDNPPADWDGDGLDVAAELLAGTSSVDADSDDDGIDDGEELVAGADLAVTSPVSPDSDGDGVQDGTELGYAAGVPDPDGAGSLQGTNPALFVPDADPASTTDPNAPDTDLGGETDGSEDANANGLLEPGERDPNDGADDDVDGDGLGVAAEGTQGTNPQDADSDDDGLSDGAEVATTSTRPTVADSDGDGLQDGTEAGESAGVADPDGGGPLLGTDPGVFVADADPASTTDPNVRDTDTGGVDDGIEDADRDGALDPGECDPTDGADDGYCRDGDGDGLSDGAEYDAGSDASNPDSDGDTLLDGLEVNTLRTSPMDLDSDDDGIADDEELVAGSDGAITDPSRADTDGDGLQDGTELGYMMGVVDADGAGLVRATASQRFTRDADPATTTDPNAFDTDGGGAADGIEDANRNGRRDPGEPDPRAGQFADDVPDADTDGVPDAVETLLGTRADAADTDGDGIADAEDAVPGADGFSTNALDADADDDGLSDGDEVAVRGTDPTRFDTDGDGLGDGLELGVTAAIPDPDGAGPASGTNTALWRTDADPATTTNPLLIDTDGGGAYDGNEDITRDGRVTAPFESNPNTTADDGDADGDGIRDSFESSPFLNMIAGVRDSDGDGILDGAEGIPGPDGYVTTGSDADTDDDGISDGDEVRLFATSPVSTDSDGDALLDSIEAGRTTPIPDPDGAGPRTATNAARFVPDADPGATTSPSDSDTDEGGIADGNEDIDRDGLFTAPETDPLATFDDLPDTDRDGLGDAVEVYVRLDPTNPDSDGDGILDGEETVLGADGVVTDPYDADMDDDGIPDGEELVPGTDGTTSDPSLADTDRDGLQDGTESGRTRGVRDADGFGLFEGTDTQRFQPDLDPSTTTDPRRADTDGGGAGDGAEDVDRNGRVDGTESNPVAGNAADDTDGDGDGVPNGSEAQLGLDPAQADTDRDGLSDGQEIVLGTDGFVTNPFDLDTDDDALNDGQEVNTFRTSPVRDDTDGDGVQDGTELRAVSPIMDPDGNGPLTATDPLVFRPDLDPAAGNSTSATVADTDGGGAYDGAEDINWNGRVDAGETNPVTGNAADDADTDGDGVGDGVEAALGTDPNDPDSDGDLLEDGEELVPGGDRFVTDPLDADTDDDGLDDFTEVVFVETSPVDADTDGDGIQDGTELGVTTPLPDTDTSVFVPDADPSAGTNPHDTDTDEGGISDGGEDRNFDGQLDAGECDPDDPSDDLGCLDTDGDRLLDTEEGTRGTDPLDPDTDGDGASDGDEVLDLGTDPLDLDTDDDGLSDGDEVAGTAGAATDPSLADTDGDGLQDGTEQGLTAGVDDPDGGGPLLGTDAGTFVPDADDTTTTDPNDPDTDGGTASDGAEDVDGNGRVDAGERDPNDPADDLGPDADGDGLADDVETAAGTDPADADSDDDGLADGLDGLADTDGDGRADALDPDSDDDGLPDGLEAGVTTPGPDTDVAAGAFVADTDPATTTDPDSADSDGGGVADGAEDRDADGSVDASEIDPENPADDATRPCGPAPLPEVDGPPVNGQRVSKAGADLVVAWTDMVAATGDACLVYRVYAAVDARPAQRSDYTYLGTVTGNSFRHVGAAQDGRRYAYVVTAFSLAAGEGTAGSGRNPDGSSRPRW